MGPIKTRPLTGGILATRQTMNMKNQSAEHKVITVLDVGSFKIAALVARETPDGDFECLSMSVVSAAGIKDGVVVDLDKASEAIQHVIKDVQQESGCSVTEVVVIVGGRHVRSWESSGMAVVSGGTVTQTDIDCAIETANDYPVSADEQILHTFIQGYSLDGQDGVTRPLGLAANRIEVKVLRITARKTSISNLVTCVRRSGVIVSGLIPQALAASNAVLSDEDRMEGICLVAMGSTTTDLAVFNNGVLVFLRTIPSAGDAISSHIADYFHIPFVLAEWIKTEHGDVAINNFFDIGKSAIDKLRDSLVVGHGDFDLARLELAKLIRPQVEALACQIRDILIKENLWHGLRKGIALTGGSANLAGIFTFFSNILRCPVSGGVYVIQPHSDKRTRSSEYMAAVGALWKLGRPSKH